MFNKLYEWIGTGLASLRSGAPGTVSETAGVKQDGRIRRKRPINCVEDEEGASQEDGTAKRSKIGDLMDTMKTAAEGVKNQGSSMALWMRSSLNPSLSSILTSTGHSSPAALQLDLPSPSASVSDNSEFLVHTSSASDDIFIAPSTSVRYSIFSTDSLSSEEPLHSLKTCRRQVCPDPVQNQTPKTNGHSASLSAFKSPNSCPCPRLGRSLLLGARRSLSHVRPVQESTGSSPLPRAHEKSAPARVVQSSCARRSRFHRRRPFCTAQESVREEEKEVYRQLLAVVSGTHCPLFRDGTLSTPLRSHRDLTSFLTSSRRLLQSACSVPERRVEALDHLSGPPSPLGESSLSSSNVPSPGGESSEAESQAWPGLCHLHPASPQAAAACDTSSQDTQSSAQDGDSVIFVKEEQPREMDSSSVPCFKAELWIKELTSLYDSRARERRRLIEEQEALATQLLHQRLSEQSHVTPSGVELQVRVPLEKEVPLAPIVEELKPKEDVEFPELTEAMEREINRALRGGSPDEVLSEGFRLTITRKDLQTLSHLNWLNDEVINFYMNLLVERSQQPGLPSVYTFNTFFYPKLRSAGFSAVRRWTKKVDVFSFDILLVPVHLGVHWCLSVVDFRNRSVTYFDSMGGNNDEACRVLLKYLEQEGKEKKGHVLDASQWVLRSKKRHEIPQQMNGSDCGMFTCKYADYITKDKSITFTQKHMPYFRRRMVWEILNRKLL